MTGFAGPTSEKKETYDCCSFPAPTSDVGVREKVRMRAVVITIFPPR
jgi:hypothetical protein